MEEEIKPYLP